MKKTKKPIRMVGCYSCKKSFFVENMNLILIMRPREDGYVDIKAYLCEECYKKLEKYKFIEEGKEERKKNLKRVVKEIRDKEGRE